MSYARYSWVIALGFEVLARLYCYCCYCCWCCSVLCKRHISPVRVARSWEAVVGGGSFGLASAFLEATTVMGREERYIASRVRYFACVRGTENGE